MANRIAHLIYTPFTGVGIPGFKSQEWLKDRVEVYKKYTLESLKNQTDRNFLLWLSFRPDEAHNPTIDSLFDYLRKEKWNFIATFEGLIYYDDKFSEGLWNRAKNIGRLVRQWYRTGERPNFMMAFANKNASLLPRLSESLKAVAPHLQGADWIYVSRIDSDDMFHKSYIELTHNIIPFAGSITVKKGYVYEEASNSLAYWKPKTNPPFHTIMYPGFIFFDAWKHLEFMRGFTSHEDIPYLWPTKVLPDGLYCVLVRNPNSHISTIWNHPFKGDIVTENKVEILSNFGINVNKETNKETNKSRTLNS